MKKLFIRVFSENIAATEFQNFYAAVLLLIRGRHLKYKQIEVEVNGEITQKLAEISEETRTYTGSYSNTKSDSGLIDKSFKALQSRLKLIAKNIQIEIWMISDWKNISEGKFEKSLDLLTSSKQAPDVFYFYENGKENNEISAMVKDSFEFSSHGAYERLSRRTGFENLL